MVHLSELSLDPRRRAVQRALGDSHAMHQLILLGFPDGDRESLGRVLFRLETARDAVRVLVQSPLRPDWGKLRDMVLAVRGPRELNLYRSDGEPIFRKGQMLRFRLAANPTFRAGKSSTTVPPGKRTAILTRAGQAEWIRRKGRAAGFELVPVPQGPEWFDPFEEDEEARVEVRITPLNFQRGSRGEERLTHMGVRFDGLLRVVDPQAFAQTLQAGVGSGKAFGFGLLSVARV